ncbi:MAG: hypothetical protein SAK29_18285 [Scytonema sp. PMC 1069.18]|nr:hypothetical protein [Scytonema sp. PMC 1069.18]MEC4887691.1 hypothetical protein [Scytonema sp. PMC 1070.18]
MHSGDGLRLLIFISALLLAVTLLVCGSNQQRTNIKIQIEVEYGE